MPPSTPPSWQLPPGLTRGAWDYTQSPEIAASYDEEFKDNELFQCDLRFLKAAFTRPGRLIDLGCGTGRLLLPFALPGWHALGVDLSPRMLQCVQQKAAQAGVQVDCVIANLLNLNCVAAQSADYAICMFSTLGMIQGRAHRRAVLRQIHRLLVPGGLFVMHVHNTWFNLVDSHGRRWLVANWLSSLLNRDEEFGDKTFDYRGIPRMFLHTYRLGELKRDLKQAGFHVKQVLHLNRERTGSLKWPWLLAGLRANGWIVTCAA